MSSQVVTSTEGENESFDFVKWINKHQLQEIKDLFIKHNATTPSTLTISSPQLQALMMDPILLSQPIYIQKILNAMTNIQFRYHMYFVYISYIQ